MHSEEPPPLSIVLVIIEAPIVHFQERALNKGAPFGQKNWPFPGARGIFEKFEDLVYTADGQNPALP